MRINATILCDECGLRIDTDGPAVCNDKDSLPHWEPFVEDLRSDPKEHRHGACFANTFGIDALIEAVRREDLRRRR